MAPPYWTAGRVVGVALLLAGIGLLVAEILEPSAAASASRVVPGGGGAWGQIYDVQFAHLQELDRGAVRFAVLGAIMACFLRRWLRWRFRGRTRPVP